MIFPRFACALLLCAASVSNDSAVAQLPGSNKSKPRTQLAARLPIHTGPYLELGPLLGHVSSTNAKIWVKASAPALLSVVVGENEDLSDRVGFKAPKLDAANFFSGHVLATDLKPNSRYYYAVLIDGALATPKPFPSFKTAPIEGASGHQRFAFASCVGYNGYDSAATWADMATRTNFDVLLMLGDNHYGNVTEPAKHFEMFGVQRRLPGYADVCRRVPQYAIWDNHDYAPEPTDKRAKGKEDSLRAFKMLWPNPAYGEKDNPGVYFKFTRGDIDFFMLDGRYHRDPNNAPEDGHKSHLGEKQLAWLKRELVASKAKIKVLATGGEWQTHGQAASWTSFLRERDDLFKFIEDNGITGVLLLSGDRHFTAAYQAAGKFTEVTSGPLGSSTVDPKPTPEMFWNGGKTGKFYCIYDVNTTPAQPEVTLEIYRASEGRILRRAFTWDEVLGKTKIKPLPQRAPGVPSGPGAVQ
jgi:alkaline phosphatase D